jgi:cell division protein FtsB
VDSNTFALFVLGFGTIIIALVVWQVFAIARDRMSLTRNDDLATETERCHSQLQQLDTRLTALADDVHTIEQRVTELEGPERRAGLGS